ncbi:hypothetical protein BDV95DRAFT_443246, partial [Massariosphaeria phaeospora]
LAFAASTTAQYWNISSKPFNLVLVSDDASVNGETLSACHTGAAIESLCLSNSTSTSKSEPISAAVFTFNTSVYASDATPFLGPPGLLAYTLNANPAIPSSVQLYVDPITNVALPLLYPGESQQTLLFNKDNFLAIQGYVDDTGSAPVAGEVKGYERWYSCTTYYGGYQYVNLAWTLGDQTPQNPTCIKVWVKRVFI